MLKVEYVKGRGKGRRSVLQNMPNLHKLLSDTPYPGTFNVVFDSPFELKRGFILDDRRDRAGVPAKINGIPCVAYRFRHAPLHVLELISNVKLSEVFAGRKEPLQLEICEAHLVRPSTLRQMVWRLYYGSDQKKYYEDKKYQNIWGKNSLHKLATQRKF